MGVTWVTDERIDGLDGTYEPDEWMKYLHETSAWDHYNHSHDSPHDYPSPPSHYNRQQQHLLSPSTSQASPFLPYIVIIVILDLIIIVLIIMGIPSSS